MAGKAIVSKSNKLVEMRLLNLPATMGKAELKIANAIYSKVLPDDGDFKEYAVPITELAELAGLDGKQLYKDIKRITKNLLTTLIVIEEPSSQDWLQACVFSTAEYKAKDECVYFQVAGKLKPYLLRLKDSGCGFTQYYLEQTTRLQSKYSLRIYELLRQFLPIKKVREGATSGFRRVLVSDLREYLGVKNKYSKFAIFRRDVLEPAQRELAAKTDLCFEFTSERTRRTITSLNFTIRVNESKSAEPETIDDSLEPELLPVCTNETMLRMVKMSIPNIPEKNAILLANSYSQDVLTEALLGLMEARGEVRNPVAYLSGILKNKRLNEPARAHRTTEEKLTDRSWAEGLKFDDDWD